MGRNTPPIRSSFSAKVAQLRKEYRDALVSRGRRAAFDELVGVWSAELGAFTYAESFNLIDLMLLTGEVENRRLIDELMARLEKIKLKTNEQNERKTSALPT